MWFFSLRENSSLSEENFVCLSLMLNSNTINYQIPFNLIPKPIFCGFKVKWQWFFLQIGTFFFATYAMTWPAPNNHSLSPNGLDGTKKNLEEKNLLPCHLKTMTSGVKIKRY